MTDSIAGRLLSRWYLQKKIISQSSLNVTAEELHNFAINSIYNNFDWKLRETAFRFISFFTIYSRRNIDQSNTSSETAPELLLLLRGAEDRDPRVRAASIEGLLYLCENDLHLPLGAYEIICQLCSNSDEKVRLSALVLITNFADRFPQQPTGNPTGIRMADSAFSHVCQAMHDTSPLVRVRAAELLGRFKAISLTFLEQTLDKKLMFRMKAKSSKQGTCNSHRDSTNEWSTGRKLGEDVPMEIIDDQATSMIPSGACGAFVSGLEDEHMVVRQAAVRSLSTLAIECPIFASKALDHLADMFNDEIEQVRLDAIQALTPLVELGQINDDQLDTMLTVLHDALPDSRSALRDLLAKSRMTNIVCIRMTIMALLINLTRFPQDRRSIWMSELALSNILCS